MSDDVDTRVSRLLDQLENPYLSREQQERIQSKVEFLRGLGRSSE